MLWIILSILAAIFWGLNYVLGERILKQISVATLMSLELFFALIVVITVGLLKGSIATDLQTIWTDKKLAMFVILSIIAFTLGSIAIFSSIVAKNATLAGIIEVSYPLFIVLFSWLILGQSHLSKSVIIGGVMIIAGVLVVYLGS
ncbi:MAG TPA: DMT family transporter [Alphaproteobacteria bacterium]|nr:DMT family transporter [Alphaproteobacteria bacterium]